MRKLLFIELYRPALALATSIGLSACGGGGPEPESAAPPGALQGVLRDLPADGLLYFASPSGLSGTTHSGGRYAYLPGDTVSFALATGRAPVALAARVHDDSAEAAGTRVTALEGGQELAELLRALDHGSNGRLQVGGLDVPEPVAARIGAYVASGGENLAGLPSNDAFLRDVRSGVVAPAPFAVAVTGEGNDFLLERVLPELQDAMEQEAGAGEVGAAMVEKRRHRARTFRLSGTMTHTGTARLGAVPGCERPTITFTGGGILNATLQGDVRRRGTYAGRYSAGTYRQTTTIPDVWCTDSRGNRYLLFPRRTVSTVAPAAAGPFTLTSDGRNLTVNGRLGALPAGCTGPERWTGTQVGAANPMLTMRMTIGCMVGGSSLQITLTVKMVGAP